jgi:hypothetical protein
MAERTVDDHAALAANNRPKGTSVTGARNRTRKLAILAISREGRRAEILAGEYASQADDAGMLGYVQQGTCADWAPKIERALHSDRVKYQLVAGDQLGSTISDARIDDRLLLAAREARCVSSH